MVLAFKWVAVPSGWIIESMKCNQSYQNKGESLSMKSCIYVTTLLASLMSSALAATGLYNLDDGQVPPNATLSTIRNCGLSNGRFEAYAVDGYGQLFLPQSAMKTITVEFDGAINENYWGGFVDTGVIQADGAQVFLTFSNEGYEFGDQNVAFVIWAKDGNWGYLDKVFLPEDFTPHHLKAKFENGQVHFQGQRVSDAASAFDLSVPVPQLDMASVTKLFFSVGNNTGAGPVWVDNLNITVQPLDVVAPVLTLLGDNPLFVECGDVFEDPGATAADGIDGDLTAAIQVSGQVNPAIVGDYLLTYTVADQSGNTASVTRTVKVVDTTPPVITEMAATPNVLWPPNRKMVPVAITLSASDLNGITTSRIIAVNSNEPDPGQPDWEITGDLTVQLRAERSGSADGRIYVITVECLDAYNNATQATVMVSVPHDQRKP
jgi:hypothetical protein